MTDTLYATVAEFKSAMELPSTNTDFDARIQKVLNAAAEAIDGFCNQGVPFVAGTASTRQYPGNGKTVLYMHKCTQVTLVEYRYGPSSSYLAYNAADWLPFSGDEGFPNFDDKPFSGLMLTLSGQGVFPSYAVGRSQLPTVRVTAKWGYADAVPARVNEATIDQAMRWFKRAQGGFGDTLASADFGMLMFKKALDPDIQFMLQSARLVRPAI